MITLPKLPRSRQKKTLAVMTSGGDAPGMNAAIRAVVRYALAQGSRVYGIEKGYSGLLEGQMDLLSASSVANIIQRGGTLLKTDRCEAFFQKSVRREAAHLLRRKGIEGLIVIGGDGSFTGAHLLEKETGFPTIGIPGTIDNDIAGTDDTIGFDTAVNTALEAIDRIRDTASSHDRVFIVEVMGRSSGWIGLQVGIGGGAETLLLPELDTSFESVCQTIERGKRRGKRSSIIVMAEGPKPGLSERYADELEKRGYPSKVCILGHTQRGGPPTAHDRVLASAMGAAAVAYLLSGKSDSMVGILGGKIGLTPFSRMIKKKKPLDRSMLELARVLAT